MACVGAGEEGLMCVGCPRTRCCDMYKRNLEEAARRKCEGQGLCFVIHACSFIVVIISMTVQTVIWGRSRLSRQAVAVIVCVATLRDAQLRCTVSKNIHLS